MRKSLVFGLVCLFLVCGCKKKLPTSPDIPVKPEIVLPTIVSFTSSNPDKDRYITISWEVKNATSIWLRCSLPLLHRDVSHRPIGSSDYEVCGRSPWDAIKATYTLSASNDDGDVREEIEVASASSQIEMSVVADETRECYYTAVYTETYGVGGRIQTTHWIPGEHSSYGNPRPLEPYGTVISSPFYTSSVWLNLAANVLDTNGFDSLHTAYSFDLRELE